MTTTATEARVAARRAHLTKQRAERLDPLDFPLAWTTRQVSSYEAETAQIDQQIATLNAAAATLAQFGSVETITRWRDFSTKARATLSAERMTIKSPIRDRDLKRRADDLEWSIKLIDKGFSIATLGIETLEPTAIGQLMRAGGYAVAGAGLRGPNGWGGSLPEVEQRLKTLTAQRAAAEAALDAALIDDAARADADAEHDAYREALKMMRLQGNADGTGLIAFDPATDEPLDASAMTDVQRKAVAWFEAVAYPPREPVQR